MANPTGAFGLRPVRHISGAPYNGATVKCYVSASYAVALFVGDAVLISPTDAELDATAKYQTINFSDGADGDIIRGVITSFEPTDRDSKVYNPASTERYANVCMDPSVIFQIRGDGGGTPTDLFVNSNAIITTGGTGSTVTGLSGQTLDEGSGTAPTTTQTLPLHIVGIADLPDNELGDNAVWEVLLNTYWATAGSVLGIT